VEKIHTVRRRGEGKTDVIHLTIRWLCYRVIDAGGWGVGDGVWQREKFGKKQRG